MQFGPFTMPSQPPGRSPRGTAKSGTWRSSAGTTRWASPSAGSTGIAPLESTPGPPCRARSRQAPGRRAGGRQRVRDAIAAAAAKPAAAISMIAASPHRTGV